MKSLFNFYLDDSVKKALQDKLRVLTGDTPKGQLAALIRVLLKVFLATKTVDPLLVEAVAAEYEYSCKKNKRSMN